MKKIVVLSFCIFLIFGTLSVAQAERDRPTLLFTKEVIDTSKKANEKMAQVESSMSTTFAEVDKTRQLYEESGCSPDSTDQGCLDIKRQMQEAYLGMLGKFENALPDVRNALKSSSRALGGNLARKVGRKFSPQQMDTKLRKEDLGPRNRIPNRSSVAKRLASYLRLISNSNMGSPEVLAAEIFLDQQDAIYNLKLLQMTIQQQQQVLQAEMAMGSFNEQSIEKAELARNIIFGDGGDRPGPDEPPSIPNGKTPKVIQSPPGPLSDL